MILNHKRIAGRTIEIVPMVDKSYPNHSATLSERQDGNRWAFYTKVLKSQEEGIRYARDHGYDIPFGF